MITHYIEPVPCSSAFGEELPVAVSLRRDYDKPHHVAQQSVMDGIGAETAASTMPGEC